MKRILWDVDTQVDFMEPSGNLYVPNARDVAPAMERIVKAEAAAMRVTLAVLLAEIGAPAAVPADDIPVRAVADGIASE